MKIMIYLLFNIRCTPNKPAASGQDWYAKKNASCILKRFLQYQYPANCQNTRTFVVCTISFEFTFIK